MRHYLYPFFIFAGLALGWIFPFYALSLSRWAFLFLFILLLINIFPVDLKLKSIIEYKSKEYYFVFFSYFFLPALVYIIAYTCKINQSLMLGFFLTTLAPLAIITPQFLKSNADKMIALRLILTSTFLFPIYFTVMLFLFFPKMVKFNSMSIIQDSFILTSAPLLIVLLLNKYFIRQKEIFLKRTVRFLPVLNMVILGILCFIFVGSSFLKNDMSSFTLMDWVAIFILALFQDFGVYFISRYLEFEKTFRVCISMKNVAFIGTFSLIFFPKALLPTIAILVAHVFLILYFSFTNRDQMHLSA